MKEINNKGFVDDKCFRFKKNVPKHDTKYSIRKESIFENIKINLIVIYFLIYECFANNLSSNKVIMNILNLINILIQVMYQKIISGNYFAF